MRNKFLGLAVLFLTLSASVPTANAGEIDCGAVCTVGDLAFSNFFITGADLTALVTANQSAAGVSLTFDFDPAAEVYKDQSLSFSLSYTVTPLNGYEISSYDLLLYGMKHAGHSGGEGNPAAASAISAAKADGSEVWSLNPAIDASPNGKDKTGTANWIGPPAIGSSLTVTHTFDLYGGTKVDSPADRVNARVSGLTETFGLREGDQPLPGEVPEPLSMLLIGSGLAVLGVAGRRRILR